MYVHASPVSVVTQHFSQKRLNLAYCSTEYWPVISQLIMNCFKRAKRQLFVLQSYTDQAPWLGKGKNGVRQQKSVSEPSRVIPA